MAHGGGIPYVNEFHHKNTHIDETVTKIVSAENNEEDEISREWLSPLSWGLFSLRTSGCLIIFACLCFLCVRLSQSLFHQKGKNLFVELYVVGCSFTTLDLRHGKSKTSGSIFADMEAFKKTLFIVFEN